MTPAERSSRMNVKGPRADVASKTPRCEHTLLTKPECHCPACLTAQIAAHGRLATPS
jgi:hypothetical protein